MQKGRQEPVTLIKTVERGREGVAWFSDIRGRSCPPRWTSENQAREGGGNNLLWSANTLNEHSLYPLKNALQSERVWNPSTCAYVNTTISRNKLNAANCSVNHTQNRITYLQKKSQHTSWLTCENVGFWICNLSAAILFRAVLSSTTFKMNSINHREKRIERICN